MGGEEGKTKRKRMTTGDQQQRLLDLLDSFRYTPSAPAPAPAPKQSHQPFRTPAPPKDKIQRKCRSVLTAEEKTWEAYRRLPPGFRFVPPRSPFRLLQETHAFDPWRVLVICLLLNRTSGNQVRRVLGHFFSLCPDAHTTLHVDPLRIQRRIRTLGLHRDRTQTILDLSWSYLYHDWHSVAELPGVGKYAADAYAIFCSGRGADVRPEDHMLVHYWNYVYGPLVAELPQEDTPPELPKNA